MPYSVVQTIDAGTTTAGTSVTSGSYTLTAGNRIILVACFYGNTDISTTMSDTLGNSYSKVPSGAVPNAGSSGVSYCAWECKSIATGGATAITLNFSSSAGNSGFSGYEVSGLDGSAAVQVIAKQVQVSPGTATDGIVSGSLTPTSAPAMVFGWSQGSGENQQSSAGTGFAGTQCPNVSVINGGSKTLVENERITSTSALANGATFTASASAGGATYINYGLIVSEAGGGGGTAYTLTAATGFFSLTGESATRDLALPANEGAFSFTGFQTHAGYGVNASMTPFAFTGFSASLVWSGAPVVKSHMQHEMSLSYGLTLG